YISTKALLHQDKCRVRSVKAVVNDSSIASPSTPPGTVLNFAEESYSTWLDYVGPLITDELDYEKRWSYRDPDGNVQGFELIEVFGKSLLIGLAPVLVESLLHAFTQMFSPDGVQRSKTTRGLDVSHNTNDYHGWGVNDRNSLTWVSVNNHEDISRLCNVDRSSYQKQYLATPIGSHHVQFPHHGSAKDHKNVLPDRYKQFLIVEGCRKEYGVDGAVRKWGDVVGYVTNVGRITQTRTGSKILDFYMAKCRGQQIRVTLWGGFDDMLIEKRTRHVGLYPVVITAMSVKLYNNRLYLSSTSSTLIVDDAKIPLLTRLKTNDSGVTLTKEILSMDNTTPKVGTLKNLLMWAQNQKYDVTIDKVRTKKGWNYPSCGGDKCKKGNLDRKDGRFWCDSCNSSVDYPVIRYKLELEISDETAEAVVVMFDETARVLLNCSASSILECEGQDEEASLGLPTALANIVVTCEDVEKGASSATAAANDASKASELKRLNKAPAVATPSKSGEEKKQRRENLKILTQRHPLLQTANQKKEMWHVLLTREKERGLFWMIWNEQPECDHLGSTIIRTGRSNKQVESYVVRGKNLGPECSAFFASSDILYNQSLGKYEFRWERNNHADRPSLSNILHTSVTIHSNTFIRRDGTMQSFCGLRLSDIGTSSKLAKGGTGVEKRSVFNTPDHPFPKARPSKTGKKRAAKKARKPATLSSTGTEVSCHNLDAPTYQCRGCNAIMWIDHSINVGRGLYTFHINGQICHRIGSLVPKESTQPSAIAKVFRMAMDWCHLHVFVNVELRLLSERTSSRQYNAPTVAEVAALITNDFGDGEPTRDIVVNKKDSGPRYMMQNYQDEMALCRAYGNPDLFITFTSNPKWPKISKMLAYIPGQRAHDRPEVGTRVFKLKLTELLNDLTKNQVFEESRADVLFRFRLAISEKTNTTLVSVVYVIEFQKRGLPHAHILLWLEEHDKCKTPGDIDDIISTELSSPTDDPKGRKAVTEYMLHRPCGKGAACNVEGKCSKHFPKAFCTETIIDQDGYPIYRRRDNKVCVKKGKFIFDNKYVVPHNRYLLLKYQAHINVEWCNRSKAIKYLFKYLNKGLDRATIVIEENVPNGQGVASEKVTVVDEIKNYLNCRYLAPCEAVWRIFLFVIHYAYPSVMKLNFHLPNQHPVTLRDSECLPALLEREGINVTMFNDWFDLNERHPPARTLTYAEIPEHYVWHEPSKMWQPQKQRKCIGRIVYSTPASGERYFLWILLNVLTMEQIQNYCLVEIQELLKRNGRTLTEFQDLPQPNPKLLTNMENHLIREALAFDMHKSKLEHQQLHSQRHWEDIPIQDYHFKTKIRTEDWISSLLLPAKRTAHSRFVIPLELLENSTRGIKQNTHLAELMQEVELIIWDEALMTQKYAFEALDKTLRDILGYPTSENRNKIFGGMTVLLAGDFRQILPVIPKGKRTDIVQACINRSVLWKHCKVFTLTRSMRVNEYYANGEIDTQKRDFNQWVLAVSDGNLLVKMKDGEDEPTWIEIPEKFLINSSNSPIEQIVAETYPNFIERQRDDAYLRERAILTPRNDDADAINAYMFDKLEGESVTYNSADEICKASIDILDQHHLYPIEFLNTLDFPGMPPTP
ncbi:uncharacterized protein Tco_0458719, partial [Tanacetum coccineum]